MFWGKRGRRLVLFFFFFHSFCLSCVGRRLYFCLLCPRTRTARPRLPSPSFPIFPPNLSKWLPLGMENDSIVVTLTLGISSPWLLVSIRGQGIHLPGRPRNTNEHCRIFRKMYEPLSYICTLFARLTRIFYRP